MSVASFMSSASSPRLVTCTSTTPIREAARRMSLNKVSCAVIVDVDDSSKYQAQGIITNSDIVRSVANDVSPDDAISAIMTPVILTINGEYSLRQAAEAFVAKNVHHLAVSENGVLKGVLSSYDVAKELALESKVWPYSRSFIQG